MKEKSFKVYIVRLLKNIHPGIRLTKNAAEAIDSILRVIATKIVDKALVLTATEDKKTISEKEIQTATKVFFPSEFAENILTFSNTILEAYEKSEKEREGQPVEKAQTRESRCGLVFSVSATEKYVRRFGQIGWHVSSGTPIVLSAILENFCSTLLKDTGNITQTAKKITINIRHLFLATKNNPSLSFVNNLGIVFLEGGVQPQLLQNKKHKRIQREKSETANTEKAHRWRPGTKTIMEIRRLQKSGDLLMQRAPFVHLIREIISTFEEKEAPKTRLTGEFSSTLQAFAEDRMVNLMTQANRLAQHAGRETVYSRDIELVCELSGQAIKPHSLTSTIPEAAIRQMALRAGIQRFGDCCTQTYRNYLVNILTSYMYEIVLCARHHKIQTFNTKILLEVMSMRGLYPTIIAHKRKVGKTGASRKTSKAITEHSQDVSDVEEEEEEEEEDEENGTAVAN